MDNQAPDNIVSKYYLGEMTLGEALELSKASKIEVIVRDKTDHFFYNFSHFTNDDGKLELFWSEAHSDPELSLPLDKRVKVIDGKVCFVRRNQEFSLVFYRLEPFNFSFLGLCSEKNNQQGTQYIPRKESVFP